MGNYNRIPVFDFYIFLIFPLKRIGGWTGLDCEGRDRSAPEWLGWIRLRWIWFIRHKDGSLNDE